MRKTPPMPMSTIRRGARLLVALALVSTAAGCGDRLAGFGGGQNPPPATPAPTPPPFDPAGRWTLSSAGGQCAMTLSSTPGAPTGTIAPEGGCPGNFFTSRKWAFEQGRLVIQNHNGEPLARLAPVANVRFEGQATTGQPVTLAR